mgnify:CR=1 FL=1
MRYDKKAKELRAEILKMLYACQSGHPGGSLSCVEMLMALYYEVMKVDPKNPKDPDRDRFVLSKGHACPTLYAVLADLGYFPKEDLAGLRQIDSHLQGHPDCTKTPGVDMNTGSLGQGLSIGLGMALGLKLDRLDSRTYVLVGDGEIAEGQIWEAAMAASAFKADNLVAIVDRNRLQANGRTKERFDTGDIMAKFLSFGWHVIEINGHDMREILSALDEAETVKGVPTAIIANTVKGKGVSFAENVVGYHNGMLTEETYRQALLELTVQEQEA